MSKELETATIVPDADYYRAKARRLERRATAGADDAERRRYQEEAERLRATARAMSRDDRK